jgi:hypothetical protein
MSFLVDIFQSEPDIEPPSRRHCIPGIHGKVEQGHFELVGVDIDGRHVPFRLELDPNHRSNGSLDETHHVLYQAPDIGRLRL